MKRSFTQVIKNAKQLICTVILTTIFLTIHGVTIEASNVIKMKTLRSPEEQIKLVINGSGEYKVEGAKPATIGNGEAILTLTSQNVNITGDITKFDCSDNDLNSLDVSGCITLTELLCYENSLTELLLDKNSNLVNLSCDYNSIESLDLSHNPLLKDLLCPYNRIKHLDLRNNKQLTSLYCLSNQIEDIQLADENAIEEILCSGNELRSLNLQGCKNLQLLECYYNNIESLNLATNSKLTKLSAKNNLLKTLDLSNNVKLTVLSCANNKLTSISLPENSTLLSVTCFNNQLKGDAMKNLMNSLPDINGKSITGEGGGEIMIVNTSVEDKNVCYKSDVKIATDKGWKVMDFNGDYTERQAYVGEDDPVSGVNGVKQEPLRVSIRNGKVAIIGSFKCAQLYNANGQLLLTTTDHELDTGCLTPSAYILQIDGNNQMKSMKFLIK